MGRLRSNRSLAMLMLPLVRTWMDKHDQAAADGFLRLSEELGSFLGWEEDWDGSAHLRKERLEC